MEQIAIGQTWLTRGGKQVPMNNIVDSDPHPVKSGENLCWQQNGRFWDDDFDHKNDLISKIE